MSHDGDVLQVLEIDHREVEEMFARINALPTGDVERGEIAQELIAELVRHSVAEETYVYPVMREKLPDGDAKVQEELAEHAEAERIMKDLEAVGPGDAE